MDMRILSSRDPDGRIAEAIIKGRKVKSSDYSALVTHSKRMLGQGNSQGNAEESTNLHYFVGRTTSEAREQERQEARNTIKLEREKLSKRRDMLSERQQLLQERTAKRRERRRKQKAVKK